MVTIESTAEMSANIYETMERNLAIVRRRLGRPLTLADKVLLGHARRSGASGDGAGQELPVPSPRPSRTAGRARTDRDAPVHADAAAAGRGADDDPLRPPHPGARRGAGRSARVARREPGGLRLPALGGRQVRRRILGTGRRHHPPGGPRAVRVPGGLDHRDRLAHAERRRPRRVRGRCRRRRRRRGDGGAPLGGPLSPSHRGLPDRKAERLDRSQGRHPVRRGSADGRRRDQRDRGVHRPGRPDHQRDRQGDDHQHGRRARRHDLDVPAGRADGGVPASHRTRRPRAASPSAIRISWRPTRRSKPIRRSTTTAW